MEFHLSGPVTRLYARVLRPGPAKLDHARAASPDTVERQIGRLLERNTRAAGRNTIDLRTQS